MLVHEILEIGNDVLPCESLGWTGIVIEENARSQWMFGLGRLVFEYRRCWSVKDQLTRDMGFECRTIEHLLV